MISLLSDRFPHLLIGIKVAKSGYTIFFRPKKAKW